MTTWTEDRVERLKADVALNISATAIAARLSDDEVTITRNAVLGKLDRMGLKLNYRGVKTRTTPFRGLRTKEIERRKKKCGEFMGIPLLDLQPDQCRYPQGEGPFLFCGQPQQEGQPYCDTHCAICFNQWTS